jgi:hypothetical protein
LQQPVPTSSGLAEYPTVFDQIHPHDFKLNIEENNDCVITLNCMIADQQQSSAQFMH